MTRARNFSILVAGSIISFKRCWRVSRSLIINVAIMKNDIANTTLMKGEFPHNLILISASDMADQ